MSDGYFSQLFINIGEGFTEDNSQRFPIEKGDVEITFDLSEIPLIEGLRFDPINLAGSISELKMEWIYGAEHVEENPSKEVEILNDNADKKEEKHFFFLHNDPILTLQYPITRFPDALKVKFFFNRSEDILQKFSKAFVNHDPETIHYQLTRLNDVLLGINGKFNSLEGEMTYQKSLISSIKKATQNISSIEVGSSPSQPSIPESILNDIKLLAEVKSKLKVTEEKIENKNEYIEKLKTKLEFSNSENAKLLENVKSFDSKILNKTNELESRAESIKELKKTINTLNEQSGTQAKELDLKSESIKELKKSIIALNEQSDVQAKELAKVNAKEKEVEKNKLKVESTFNNKINKLVQDKSLQKTLNTQLKKEISSLQKELKISIKNNTKLELKMEAQSAELKNLQLRSKEYDKLLRTLSKMEKEVEDLNINVLKNEKEVESLTLDNEVITAKNKKLTNELSRLEDIEKDYLRIKEEIDLLVSDI